jgi:ketosteroid isomerase-like protein
MKGHLSAVLAAVLLVSCMVVGSARGADGTAVDEIAAVLDEFNRAASEADSDAYYACLSPDAILLGTAAEERFTVAESRVFMKPYFAQERGRQHAPRDRHITLLPSGEVAFFNELVGLETLGECRGTGVVVKLDDTWRIAQYALSFPIPNEIVYEVVDRIREHDEADTPPTSDVAGIRAVLASYLAGATFPNPGPIDPEMFTDDIEAMWSDGNTYRGRDSVVRAFERSQLELAAFETFRAKAEDVRIAGRAGVAVLTCRIELRGTWIEGEEPFTRTIRSTFVFEKQGGQWRIGHEHSNRASTETKG